MHEHQQRINAQNELQSAASQSPPQQSHSHHFLDNQLIQPFTQTYPTGTSITSIDGLPILKRKRGRPPKNRVIEVIFHLEQILCSLSYLYIEYN